MAWTTLRLYTISLFTMIMIIFILEDTTDPEESFKSRRCQRICGILGHGTPNQSKMLFRKNLSFPLLHQILSVGVVF